MEKGKLLIYSAGKTDSLSAEEWFLTHIIQMHEHPLKSLQRLTFRVTIYETVRGKHREYSGIGWMDLFFLQKDFMAEII